MRSCSKKYSINFSDTRAQVSVIPGIFDEDSNTLTFFMPNPFLILGLCTLAELPQGETPSFPNSRITIAAAATQNAQMQWIQAMFIAMGFANAQPEGVSNGMTAYFQPDGFAEYMYRYLNPTILGGWYNLYIAPPNQIIGFWADEVALADPNNMRTRLRAFANFLFNQSSLPLFNPPGAYIINLDPLVNTEPYITDLLTFLGITDNVINLIVLQQNAPDLVNNGGINPNPLNNTIDSINFAGAVPDAILWD